MVLKKTPSIKRRFHDGNDNNNIVCALDLSPKAPAAMDSAHLMRPASSMHGHLESTLASSSRVRVSPVRSCLPSQAQLLQHQHQQQQHLLQQQQQQTQLLMDLTRPASLPAACGASPHHRSRFSKSKRDLDHVLEAELMASNQLQQRQLQQMQMQMQMQMHSDVPSSEGATGRASLAATYSPFSGPSSELDLSGGANHLPRLKLPSGANNACLLQSHPINSPFNSPFSTPTHNRGGPGAGDDCFFDGGRNAFPGPAPLMSQRDSSGFLPAGAASYGASLTKALSGTLNTALGALQVKSNPGSPMSSPRGGAAGSKGFFKQDGVGSHGGSFGSSIGAASASAIAAAAASAVTGAMQVIGSESYRGSSSSSEGSTGLCGAAATYGGDLLRTQNPPRGSVALQKLGSPASSQWVPMRTQGQQQISGSSSPPLLTIQRQRPTVVLDLGDSMEVEAMSVDKSVSQMMASNALPMTSLQQQSLPSAMNCSGNASVESNATTLLDSFALTGLAADPLQPQGMMTVSDDQQASEPAIGSSSEPIPDFFSDFIPGDQDLLQSFFDDDSLCDGDLSPSSKVLKALGDFLHMDAPGEETCN